MIIKANNKEISVEIIKRQNYKRWLRGGHFQPAGFSYHYDFTNDGSTIRRAISMMTTPDLLIGAFERRCLLCDGKLTDININDIGEEQQKRLAYAITNGRYGVYFDEFDNFITMDMTPLWADYAKYVSNVSRQGRLKVVCATYSINHQGKEPDCYSLHADMMDFETFIKENDGLTHGYIKASYETLIRYYAVMNNELSVSNLQVVQDKKTPTYLSENGEYRRNYPHEKIKELLPFMTSRVLHSPNQKQHFGIVYETVVDESTALQVLAAAPGLFIYNNPPRGIIPVTSNGTMFHNPKDFCNI